MEKNPKQYIKIEAEGKLNKNGEVVGWQDLPSDKTEYWSEKAFKPDAENDKKRDELFKELGNAGNKYSEIIPGKYYPYAETEGQPKGTVVSGFKFEPYTSNTEEKAALYDGLFATEKAIDDEVKARENGLLRYVCKIPRQYSEQKKAARYYIGPLDYRERTEYVGIFEDAGSDRYTPEHARTVDRCKSNFDRYDSNDENIEDKIDGRILEAFFRPLVETGFFDAKDGTPAATILTSDYDDFINKADTALYLPVEITNKNGETKIKQQPICFDLTTGHGNGKVTKIIQNFDNNHGFTDILYPSTCLKKNLAPMHDVPHFALCLPKDEHDIFRRYCETLSAQKELPKDIQDLINYQIYRQALHWTYHYNNAETQDKFRTYRRIAVQFQKRLGISPDDQGSREFLKSLQLNHPGANRFMTQYIRRQREQN